MDHRPSRAVVPLPDAPGPDVCGEKWLERFSKEKGRPLRVLHIGNIANNAYNIAKIQRRQGIHADVLCANYYHIMGCPEWEDADIGEADFAAMNDQFFPNWQAIDLGGFQRPAWFVQGPLAECIERLLRQFETNSAPQSTTPGPSSRAAAAVPAPKRQPTELLRNGLRALKEAAQRSRFRAPLRLVWKILRFPDRSIRPYLDRAWRARFGGLVKQWAELQPQGEPLQRAWLHAYYKAARLMKPLLAHYDIIQGYGADPWWPMMCEQHPYVGYEHGTLRDLPFQREPLGPLTYLAYHNADHVFVTNGDCRANAHLIAGGTVSPMLHGIDDAKHGAAPELRVRLQRQYGVRRLYLCPVRHDWEVKGTHQHIHAAALLAKAAGRDFRLFMTLWGADLQKSKELAQTLGIDDLIVWLAPMPRRKLIGWVGAMDCVLDQIRYPCFGATAPESLGCGTPVIMSYEYESTKWIIEEPAPILTAWEPKQIRDHLLALADDAYRQELASRGRAWFQRNHSSQRILAEHLKVYGRLLARAAAAGPAQRDAA